MGKHKRFVRPKMATTDRVGPGVYETQKAPKTSAVNAPKHSFSRSDRIIDVVKCKSSNYLTLS